MAIIRIAEFSKLFVDPGGSGPGQIAQTPAIAYQSFAITASSTVSAPFNAATKMIRVHTDVIASVDIRGAPVAVVAAGSPATMRFAANQTEYFGVNPGDSLAVIADT